MSASTMTEINDIPKIKELKTLLDDNITNMMNYLINLNDYINDNDCNKIRETVYSIDFMKKVINKNSGLLIRSIKSSVTPKIEYEQPPLKSSNIIAINNSNQGLINALIQKANLYPDNSNYQKNAYLTVAEHIAKNTKQVRVEKYTFINGYYIVDLDIMSGIGTSTRNFIINYLKK